MIDNFLLVDGGQFREAELRALLAGARYPGAQPATELADIKAQVAANEKGVQELRASSRSTAGTTVQRLHAPRAWTTPRKACAG